MKKLLIAVAVLLTAGTFTSCNVEMCYEITSTYSILGVSATKTEHAKTTKNNIKEKEDAIKAELKALGVSEDAIEITSKPAPDANCN